MTSSYNLSRRSLKDLTSPINWGAYQRQFGVCYAGYRTVPITNKEGGCTDWKFCVPVETYDEKSGLVVPISFPHVDATKNIQRDANGNILNDVSRHYTYDLYKNPDFASQSSTNLYPPESRRQPRAELDVHDYFRLPIRFDGTGYFPVRSWDRGEAATDYVNLPDDLNPFQLIQRKAVQEKAKAELKWRKANNIPPYTQFYPSGFYTNQVSH